MARSSALSARLGLRLSRLSLLGLPALLVTVFFAGLAEARITLTLDQTRSVTLNEEISSLVLSNPSIADITIQGPDRLLVMGRSFGTTNLIGFNANNEAVFNTNIVVTSPTSGTGSVTVFRGSSPVSYSCAPRCERVLTPGDDPQSFQSLNEQIQQRMDQSVAAAQAGN